MPTMKAVTINQYGPAQVLQLADVERPTIEPDELLVKVQSTCVNPVDCNARRGDLKAFVRLRLPAVLGIDISGTVVEVGSEVKNFKPGDDVFAFINLKVAGGYAEFAALKAVWAKSKPANVSHAEAAALVGVSVTALQALRHQANAQAGQSVLLVGASGGVGTAALQIAKALGCTVTAVCGTANVPLVQRLGADRVIDYKKQNPLEDAERFDAVIDCVGTRSFWDYRKLLKPKGTHVVVPASPKHMLNSLLSKLDLGHSSKFFFADPNAEDLDFVRQLIEAGKLKPVIDRTFPLAQLAEAHAYSESGHAVGKISISVGS